MEGSRASDGPGTVAVALDGTAASAGALAVARRLAEQLGARLTLLHLAARDEPALALAGTAAGRGRGGDRDLAGRPTPAILAATRDPAMLVLTLAGGADVGLLGAARSLAARIIQKRHGPFLLVPPTLPTPEWPGLRRLLIPLDGAPSTFRALAPVVRLAARLGATLDLLCVADPASPAPAEPGTLRLPTYLDQPHHAWDEWRREVLAALAASAGLASLPMRVHLTAAAGPTAEVILRRAEAHSADAIALVRRGPFAPGRTATLRDLLARSPSPIFLATEGAPHPPPRRPSRRYYRPS